MLRISWQTLRARRGSLAGAFVAIFLAVMLAYGTGLLMAGALSAPGPGRLAAADAVVRADPTVTVGHGDAAERVDVIPAPRLPAGTVAQRGEGARRDGCHRRRLVPRGFVASRLPASSGCRATAGRARRSLPTA